MSVRLKKDGDFFIFFSNKNQLTFHCEKRSIWICLIKNNEKSERVTLEKRSRKKWRI